MDKLEELTKQEKRALIKQNKREEKKRQRFLEKGRKIITSLLVVTVLAGGAYWWSVNQEVLPPTTTAGHTEQVPKSHVSDKPMPLQIQKHMLEHADGSGPPGVIINYNCQDFECEPDLIDKLTEVALQYPEFLYIAPFPGMSKKIVITKFQEVSTFDTFDQEALIQFIES